MLRWCACILLGVVGAATLPVGAQETRGGVDVLAYGDVATGEITNQSFEVFYPFEGREGDVLLLEVKVTDRDSSLDWPEVIVVGADGEVLAGSNGFISIHESIVSLVLPYTGRYDIIVTRDDGRSGEGVGPYALWVLQPEALQPGVTFPDAVANDDTVNYYSVQQPGFFSVYYELAGGDLNTHIEAYAVNRDNGGQLMRLASLNGSGLRSGAIGLDGTTSDLHILTVGDSRFATYFDDRVQTSDYQLRLLVND